MKQKFLIVGGVIILFIASLIFLYPQITQPSKPIESGNVVITLERTACFGTCPIYKLTIYGDGRVVYVGERFVNLTGTQTGQISQDKVKELVDEFYRIGYFSLNDRYDFPITDLPTTITSIKIDGQIKRLENYYGAPKKLDELENKIDEITDSKKWVKGE